MIRRYGIWAVAAAVLLPPSLLFLAILCIAIVYGCLRVIRKLDMKHQSSGKV